MKVFFLLTGSNICLGSCSSDCVSCKEIEKKEAQYFHHMSFFFLPKTQFYAGGLFGRKKPSLLWACLWNLPLELSHCHWGNQGKIHTNHMTKLSCGKSRRMVLFWLIFHTCLLIFLLLDNSSTLTVVMFSENVWQAH